MLKKTLFAFVTLLIVVTQLIPAQSAAALTPTVTPTATTYPDWVAYVADVTVPDGTVFAPGAAFTKTWRLKNISTSTWTADYALVFTSGEKMGAIDPVKLGKSVAPGATIDVSVNMTAPSAANTYRGNWAMKNAAGKQFGIGAAADKSFWVEIKVVSSGSATFDFAAKACDATWTSGAGALACPGTDGDAKGFILKVDKPKLENGADDARLGLVTFPQNTTNGYIQGKYPAYTVQKGDRFQSIINCAPTAKACDVFFRLDYQIGTDPIKTFWSFHEKYEGLYYRADVDLSTLAGKQVNFILTVLSNGSAADDRALWVAPVIATGPVTGPTNTPGPSSTPKPTNTPGPSPTPKPTTTAACDKVAFVSDVTIPDGTAFDAGKTFTKTWRVKNAGTCTWTTDYKLVFVSGEAMSGATATNLKAAVAPGATVDLSVDLKAPTTPATYTGNWALKNTAGKVFGLGVTADKPWWVQIKVNSGTYGVAYDFAAEMCKATWSTGAGTQPCPGASGDAKGYVSALANPKYEDGTAANTAGILTVPQNVYNGYINGAYPVFKVQKGDKFESVINCDPSAKNCYVKFRLDYKIGDGALQTLWAFYEKYEGKYYRASIDLSALAGKDVKFVLTAHAAGAATDDMAVWIGPRIMRAGLGGTPVVVTATATQSGAATVTATPTVAPSATPGAVGSVQYQNSKYGFAFKYPADGTIQDVVDNSARIVFAATSGTNLGGKYIDVVATDVSGDCKVDLPIANPTTQNVTFNGVQFLEQTGRDQGAGQIHDWIAYSTVKGNTCVSIMYVMQSGNIDNYPDPKPSQFDLNAEVANFKSIMGTFAFTAQ